MRSQSPWKERKASARGKSRVGDGRLVHTGELMKYIDILMKKEGSILTVTEENYRYRMGGN